ncbi:hypothetical protein [Streptomyces iconiensis]|uniref:Secreted protein n=1 Tax=Streptomyces iconiensis TaxID=1384038 RepID=A0ABT6ZW56_9ACTN|nr:hypothetical protein [Streptomyces iconiensis]MDJ1133310.1 hypothetical protein [Streptomyces iconiensis]
MRRLLRLRLVHAGAWTLATGAAVTLSWFGVHTVLSGTSYDPPRALPLKDQHSGVADPQASSTHRPKPPSPSASPSRKPSTSPTRENGKSQAPREPAPERSRATPGNPAPPAKAPSTGAVKGTTVPGGRAVFDMGGDSATLVSATPDSGWDMKVWNSSTWIRVTFTNGDASSSVFCRWDDSAHPRIETFRG